MCLYENQVLCEVSVFLFNVEKAKYDWSVTRFLHSNRTKNAFGACSTT